MAVPLKLYSVDSDSWDESTTSWSNEPATGVLLGTVNVTDVGDVSIDITSHVESELAGDKMVSLVLLDNSGTNQMLRFKSRSAENDPPQLAVTPSAGECTTPGTPPPDTQAPSVPSVFQASGITTHSVDLTWSASTDNVGVTGYEVFRDADLLTTTSDTGHTDNGLTPATTYTYQVRALDAAGNRSALTDSVPATTDSSSTDVITLIVPPTRPKETSSRSLQPVVNNPR